MLVNISMKFHEDISNGFQVTEGHDFVTETATYKVQRGITQKIYIQELRFLCSSHRYCFAIKSHADQDPVLYNSILVRFIWH